jgi:hypothetical protein
MGYREIALKYYGGVALYPDAQAFLDATAITDATITTAINQLVIDLKGAELWDKMKAIYPIVGGTATTHKYNLKDPRDLDVAFRLTRSGSNYSDTATGVKATGAGLLNTHVNFYSNEEMKNDMHLSFYSRTNSNGLEVEIGTQYLVQGLPHYSLLEIRTAGNTYFMIHQSNSLPAYADSNSIGFYVASRSASNSIKGFKNQTKVIDSTVVSTYISTNEITLLSLNGNYVSTKECAFASIGFGFSDSEAYDFYTIVQQFQTTLGRNV